MNLTSLDLNLLLVFEALYETGSVTLAGQRLNRAQPSVSNALGRLRHVFQDELFVRTAEGMVPTERARALIPDIMQALEQLRRALSQGVDFDPAAPQGRRFILATSDYADMVLMPRVMALLRREAPGVAVRVARLQRESIYEQLDQSAVDLAIGGLLDPPKRIFQERLYEEDFVCIGDSGRLSPPREALDLETYLGFAHALFVPSDNGSTRGVIDAHLARLGRERRVLATFAHIAALPHVVRGTDLVATIAARVARRMAPAGTTLWALPPELQDTAFGIDMLYGSRSKNDPAARWLRALVVRAARQVDG
ncbi:MAG: LysR family transcriptional regulator [Acidovorax sp.]|nr:LysR family transcriptional regulator [Acidovorax sp.]